MSRSHPDYLPSTSDIYDTVAGEIASLGGSMSDVADDGRRLFVRTVLAADAEIRPGDTIQAGVAVCATSSEILIQPYTFRLVCSNGAIAAQALQARRLERIQYTDVIVPSYDVAVTLVDLGAAVHACAAPEVFATATQEMRSAAEMEADMALQMLSSLAHVPHHMLADLLPQILERFAASGDPSAFGVVNAVTSVARDTRDAATRWKLEQLGGMIPSHLVVTQAGLFELNQAKANVETG